MSLPDGLFRVARPADPLRFTGERLTSAITGGVEMEHLHRYCFARDLCAGRDVLDVAAGEGYGTAILAGVARSVAGVEVDEEAVAHAREAYRAGNLRFEAGDAQALPHDDDAFDVVVSFETLEHLPDQRRFLAEVRRVLRPGGLFIVSTPDRMVHSGLGMPVNPYHVLELSAPEFDALLGGAFAHSAVLAQRTLAGSVLLGPGAAGAPVRTYERRDAATIEATSGVARAVYLVGLASDAPLPPLPASLYADERSVDALLASIAYERGEVAKAREEATGRFHDADMASARAAEANEALRRAEEQAAARAAEADAAQCAALDEVRERLRYAEEVAAHHHRSAEALAAQLDALQGSAGVTLGLFAVERARALPAPLRSLVHRTFHYALRRRRAGRARAAAAAGIPAAEALPAPAPLLALTARREGIPDLLAGRFPDLSPYPCFPVPAARPRLSIVTDSLGPASLFGGVATSLLLGALIAERLGADLRIVTRTDPPDAGPLQAVLASNGVAFRERVEIAYAPLDGSRDLALTPDDVFLTTSWWNTRATLGAVPAERVVALVQEDERMFYPYGDDRLRCAETLAETGIFTVINSELLFRHLTTGREALANVARDAAWFEPAFPGASGPAAAAKPRRRFFFYARPNNLRNLYWRGLEVLGEALARGLFPASHWEMHWVGKDVPAIVLPRGHRPVRHAGLDWGAYQSLVATMDAGFVLMDTPHPSYPPLDLAAAGAAVLTNTHPGKESLAGYSANILTAPPGVDGLLDGLARLESLGTDDEARSRHRAADRIGRDWAAALAPVADRVAARFARG